MPTMDDKPFQVIEAQGSIPPSRKKVDGFSRQDVVSSFQSAFQMIGGVQRLALWANANPDRFYPLYGKLLPATSFQFGENDARRIIHQLPPCALDVHPGSEDIIFEQAPQETEMSKDV
jgi:hypothetical protein